VRRAAGVVLIAAAVVAMCPDFFSPYAPSAQHRDFPYAAPGRYGDAAVAWLAPGEPYRWLGLVPASRRLFTTRGGGGLFVLGTDEFGRDWYSRLCHGASVSLVVAPAAATLALVLGVVLGAWAGYAGGWIDALVMRAGEVFLVLPWFYVVVALRAALPLTASGPATLLVLFAALAVLGCATPARLFRTTIASLREREFVAAARSAGASDLRIVRTHLLPFLAAAAWTQWLLTVPTYIVTEVTLSFLGVGAAEPTPTWGGMLAPLQQYVVLTSYPWMFAPAIAVILVCLALQVVAGPGSRPGTCDLGLETI